MVKKSVNLLPAFFRTDKNAKFLSSTLDQYIKDPKLERLDGFIGSKLSKNYNPSKDQYITSSQSLRNNYQLEPGLIIKKLDDSISKAYGYDDLINQMNYHGANVDDLNRLFKPEIYSYDPRIDWDKLINYREYYWLPTGPAPIKITGTQRELISTYTVKDDPSGDFFLFTPDGLTPDPQITLYRGSTYVFNVDSAHNFYIRKNQGYGTSDLYDTDIVGNGASKGQVILKVSYTTPNILYYASESSQIAGGQIIIKTIDENSSINVDKEIIGKKQFKSGNGVEFVNGLRINFGGDVRPATYRNKDFIVEGVGDKITLIDFSLLETPGNTGTSIDPDFDVEPFDDLPFDNSKTLPVDPSYITINRASRDLNPWTRYNRWFHSDVIRATDPNATLPIDQRARRPIIEFKPNIQLFNFGNTAVENVDLIDNLTTDAFSNVEGSIGYWVDGVQLEEGFRVIFNADPDPIVKGKIYRVEFDYIDGNPKINLIETDDGVPSNGKCATITRGTDAGTVWWYNGSQWIKGQQKTSLNQAPLFDIFDTNGYSYGGTPYTSNFRGTKIFGYAEGSTYDPVLGLNLKYRTTGLESSFLFANYFNTDTIIRVFPDVSITIPTSIGFLKSNENPSSAKYFNIWVDAEDFEIPVIQFQEIYEEVNSIEITTFDNPGLIDNIKIDTFVNDVKTPTILVKEDRKLFVNFISTVPAYTKGNRITLKIYTDAIPNSTGVYETPINLTNNPLNGPVAELILSELYDHVQTMVDRDPEFKGEFPGTSNLASLPTTSKYGTRIISNKNPLAFAQYFISNKSNNVIEAITKATDDYAQWRLNLIKTISELDSQQPTADLLDYAIAILNENKNTTFPYFLSDMLPSGTNKKTRTYTVSDTRNTAYSITSVFDITKLSNTSIIVYLNGTQLLVDRDYKFDPYDPSVLILVPLAKGDAIVIDEYLNTDGCFICPTPTKLGLFPKFEPVIYTDYSYANGSQRVIQGHDGSLLVAFNDYRDNVILEYEKRVYNNIKTSYNPKLFDINRIMPGLFRNKEYTYDQIYSLIENLFLKWTGFYGIEYEKNLTYNIDNHKTYNYKSVEDLIFGEILPGSWRAIYKYYFDTDRPNTHPWEMLGITVKPDWWDSYYGPAPYTAGNAKLWQDLAEGRTAQGPHAGINPLYARPELNSIIPVDDSGNIIDPRMWAGIGMNDSIPNTDQSWSFGDWGPAENAWRRSTHWPFAMQLILVLTKPADYASMLFDTSRIVVNNAGQYVYGTDNAFLSPASLKIHSSVVDGETVRAAGYGVYVIENGKQKNSNYLTQLSEELTHGNFNLFSKLGGFVSKDKLSIVIDAVQLGTQNPTPYLPNDDYTVHFNVSNPIKTIAISGIIIIKQATGFVIRGYDKTNLFFTIYQPIHQNTDSVLLIGGKSEEFLTWAEAQVYLAGQIVYYGNAYYRVISDHKSGTTFESKYYKVLPEIPTVGGTRVLKATKFETTETIITYGKEMATLQEVYDFLTGYNRWLEAQGFSFTDYNQDFQTTIDWDFTAKEFIYWTNQNWAVNSVITLSPFANKLDFTFQDGVIDNIFDSFYEYSILRSDGLPFPATGFSLSRENNTFTIQTTNTAEGIFYAKFNLVQKEHALVFNNTTMFGDVLYDIDTGYRQLRLKLKGFKTAEWNGDFISPGFVYDNASITSWVPYSDYLPGDLVEYVGKYYSANNKITGTQTFDFTLWTQLGNRPVAQLLPNFEYKINQFEDFYSLDIDNFDLAQQKMAQHLIGYSPRTYLENIFDNPISQYKFYQGFIKEKGTKNTLLKLEKASVANLQGRVEINEEWAFRLGYFGGFSSYKEVEFPLRENEFVENVQEVNFVEYVPTEKNNLVSYITPQNLALRPDDYVSSQTFITSTGTFILPCAGYVRLEDVEYLSTTTSALLTSTSSRNFNDGDNFWIGFEPNGGWNVYRYTKQPVHTISVSLGGVSQTIIFKTNRYHGFGVGDLIAVNRIDSTIDGVYVVQEVPTLDTFIVHKATTNIPNTSATGTIFKFNRVRFDNIDDLANVPYLADIRDGEIFWVDDDGTGKWAAFNKINNYTNIEYPAPKDQPGEHYGQRLAKQATSSTLVVSATGYNDQYVGGVGRLYVYDDIDGGLRNITNFGLNSPFNEYRPTADQSPFGDVIFYDETDDLIFASASRANYVKADTTATNGVKQARGVNITGAANTLTSVGLVKISTIYRKGYAKEVPLAVLASTQAEQGTFFGSSLHVQRSAGNKTVLVGTPGQHQGTGTVYRYDLSVFENDRIFYGITGTNSVGGSEASFDVEIVDRSYLVSIANTGSGYTTSSFLSSAIIITGDKLGGIVPDNNLIVTILSTGTYGTVVSASSTGTAALTSFTISANAQATIDPPLLNRPAQFGQKIAGNKNADLIAVSAVGNEGVVFVYALTANVYTLIQTISGSLNDEIGRIGSGVKLGSELLMSEDGKYLFIGSSMASDGILQPGKVWIYEWNGTVFEFLQLLDNPSKEDKLAFGTSIAVNAKADMLSITSQGTNFFANIIFDGGRTTFDGNSCLIGDTKRDAGTSYVYYRYNKKFLLAQELYDDSVDNGSFYGASVVVDDSTVYVGSPGSLINNNADGSVYRWNEITPSKNSWNKYRVQEDLIDVNLIKNATTIDTLTETVIDFVDVLDPLKGRIPGLADQEIRYKTPFDPAVYSEGYGSVVVNSDSYWSKNQVGELWWDLSTVKYIWYEQGDNSYRKTSWGKIFPGATIDVYEWIETTYKPSQWATLADTNAGITNGISGQPKFSDDTIYSTVQKFDRNTNQFTTLYYYWVKNKTIVPVAPNRRLPAKDVASLIEDPKRYGLQYVSIISPDALSVVNFRSNLIGDRIYLNVAYDTINNDINKHTEWVLVQEGNGDSAPPPSIERKMIDSLLGKDSAGNLVPDPTLPSRQRYGVQIRPRQTMFVKRVEALRNIMDFTNGVLKKTLTRGMISFKNLNSKEEISDISLGEYDQVFETVEARDLLITKNFLQASISCKVVNGKIIEVNVVNPGYGYLIAPSVTILNTDTDAEIKTIIDNVGSVVGATIVNPGQGFITAPALLVRPYTVVVKIDPEHNNKWSKYEWSGTQWDRIHTQKYDTTQYWKYIDWVDETFNVFKPLTATVDELYQLATLTLSPGDYVKVKNPGNARFIILRKTDVNVNGTFDIDFDIIYSELGTIQIIDSVWNTVDAQLGFDNEATFDQLLYDQTAEIELQKIITAIKDDIFVDSMKSYWNQFFFKCVKYALTEQRFLDWTFKTSFINVKNIAGVLDQRTTYRFQDPSWYESYVKEIKPYHTQIRNYQVNYQIGDTQDTPWEPSYTYNTDFDLPAAYDRGMERFIPGDTLITQYPYKSWADNYPHSVESITLVDGGKGYRTIPRIDIIPAPGDTGTGATAVAYIAFGKITEIELLTSGNGYTKTPTVVIVGGGDTELTTAIAYANLSNKKVRSNSIGIKFDRFSSTNEVTDNTYSDTFITSGNDYKFDLTWYSTTDKNNIEVYINGITVLETEYEIENYSKLYNGYHKKYSRLVLSSVPLKGRTLTITYSKNIEIYSAAGRIENYYNPTAGMPGKQLEQLMEGIAYPGVSVKGLPFNYSAFWDTTGFGTNAWDDDGTGQNDLDTIISGGDFSTSTNGAFATARGLAVSDIILDGDGFMTPYTSHAPEEMVPGQIQESVSISVFTREEQGSPLIVGQSAFIENTTTNTVVGLRLQPVSTSSVMVSFNGYSLVYGKDYFVNFANKILTINTQTTTGPVGITTIGIGGSELLTSKVVTTSDTSITISVPSLYSDIGSVYVTANGETLTSTSTGLGYTLSPTSNTNNKAKLVVRGLSGSTTIIQSWFFRPTYKTYSEVKEQIISITTTTSTFNLVQMPGTVGPFHAQAVVELDGLRLTPPDTTYYSVENNQLVFAIRPDQANVPGIFNLSEIEVYVNGVRQQNGVDFELDQPNDQIVFNPGYLNNGDVLAITTLLEKDYVIQDGQIILTNSVNPGQLLKIITYTNQDASKIRTEVFVGNNSNLYRMNRAILNDNYVWISVNGHPLINKQDYFILEDQRTVEINKNYIVDIGDKIVITSFSDTVIGKSIGFRIFKDMLGRTHYKRYSEINTTFLNQPLAVSDEVIYVENGDVLANPTPSNNVPGVVFVGGERIEYFTKTGNILGQLRRTTLGTGADSTRSYPVGTSVVDQSTIQNVPSEDRIVKQNFTATNTTTYAITGITLNSNLSLTDQVEVIYAGRVLNKVETIKHVSTATYDSGENEFSDITIPPDFYITGTNLVLSFVPVSGTRITVLKHTDRVWYDPGTSSATAGNTLLNSHTAQAQFLLERQSGLPDKYQYGPN